MRSFLLFSLLFVVAYSQTDVVLDGCYYLNGEVFGCMKATAFECDREWFFQITSPVTSERDGSFIVADGIIPFEEDFSESFELGNGCKFTLTFFDGVYDNENGIFTVQGDISTQCGSSPPDIHRINDYTVIGPRCGSTSYYSLPCPSHFNREFTAPISMDTLVESFEFYSSEGEDLERMLDAVDGCLYIRGVDGYFIAPFFCPTVLFDTCSGSNAMFTSSAGLTLKESMTPNIPPAQHCITMDFNHRLCVTPLNFEYEGATVYGEVAFSVQTLTGLQLASWFLGDLVYTFPSCGESHLVCLPEDWSISYVYFTSSWLEHIAEHVSSYTTISLSWGWHWTTYTPWNNSPVSPSPSSNNWSTFMSPMSPSHWSSPSSNNWSTFMSPRSPSHWSNSPSSHGSPSPSSHGSPSPSSFSPSDSNEDNNNALWALTTLLLIPLAIALVIIAVLVLFLVRKRRAPPTVAYNELQLDELE